MSQSGQTLMRRRVPSVLHAPLGLRWRLLLALGVVLILVNAATAYLFHRDYTSRFIASTAGMHTQRAFGQTEGRVAVLGELPPAADTGDATTARRVLQALPGDAVRKLLAGQALLVDVAGDRYRLVSRQAVDPGQDTLLLVMDPVVETVPSFVDALLDGAWILVPGVLVSGLVLLALIWRPMRRARDLIRALPLLAEKSFVELRDRLPRPVQPLRPGDEIDRIVAAIHGVADRMEVLDEVHRLAEAELRRSTTDLQLAQSMARVASWTGMPLAGEMVFGDGARDINPILGHITNWAQFLAFVHPEDRSAVSRSWRSGRPGSVMDVEFRLRINSKQFDMHAVARFDASGAARTLRASGMMQDISETRSVQRALRQHRDGLGEIVLSRTRELALERNRAERLAASKSRFLADMSHEIRTPLTTVLGLAQIGRQESRNRRIATTFEQILEAGDHLLGVINDVLDYSKLEAGRLAVSAEPFALRPLVTRCSDMFRDAVARKGLQLRIDLDDELPDAVVGDRYRVQQVLINLLSNAVKFTEHGEIGLDVYSASKQLFFCVRDTGIGMTPDQLHELFTPFHQHADKQGGHREGSGLGLTISKRIATLMGGDIQVRSRRGEGSRFLLHLPLRITDAATNPAGQAPDGIPRLDGIRALVVDDVAVNRGVIEHLLRLQGVDVDTADDGAEAVAAVLDGDYDIVLMDVQMPGVDGREATRRIRRAGCNVPVIGVSAHVADEQRLASLAAGMQEQLIKPLLQEELVEAISANVPSLQGEHPDAGRSAGHSCSSKRPPF